MKRLIIDTDPGVDDSMAILLALHSPEVQVEALTTVFGNGGVAQTTANALRVLELAGRSDIPVVAGATKPLLHDYYGQGFRVHGRDGLGETNFPPPQSQARAGRAAEFLVSQIMAAPGEITLVALGPLTNLALAVSLEPQIASKVREVVFMGGVVAAPGNASPLAEANIHNDAAAAKIVFQAGWPLTMLGLDVTRKTVMDPAYLARLKAAQTPITDFISAITPFYLRFYQANGTNGFHVHDSSALAYVIDPTLFQSKKVYVDVAIGDRNNGQTMADWRGQWEQPANLNVCLEVDTPRFLELYYQRVTGRSNHG
jgi:inosine-uridine nucleoside N-ribohydrolase